MFSLIQFIKEYKDNITDWNYISEHQDITFDFIRKHPEYPWNYGFVSMNENITMEHIKKYPDFPWKWDGISQNPNMTEDIIKENMDLPWKWSYLSFKEYISLEFIENNIDKEWSFWNMSARQDITLEFINKHIDENWNWFSLTKKSFITWEYIEKHLDKYWNRKLILIRFPEIKVWEKVAPLFDGIDWDYLSSDVSELIITSEIVEKYIDKRWNFNKLFSRGIIDIEFVKKHKDNIDISRLLLTPKLYDTFYKQSKRNYALNIQKDLKNELERRETRSNRYLFDLCIHEINMKIRDKLNREKLII